jgi:hypothetical protein
MNVEKTNITKYHLTDVERLDPIAVYAEDFGPRRGQITITCYGESWTASWGGMGERNVVEFFLSCDQYYLAKNLSSIDSQIYDIDAIREEAKEKDIDCWRDDPWNDYEFLTEMYGPDPYNWYDDMPKIPNPDYEYLLRIILAVQEGLKTTS